MVRDFEVKSPPFDGGLFCVWRGSDDSNPHGHYWLGPRRNKFLYLPAKLDPQRRYSAANKYVSNWNHKNPMIGKK
jgi:hypothetical protein